MALQENINHESVQLLPWRETVTVAPDTDLRTAIAAMRARRLGCAVVVDPDGKPLGTFTERTIVSFLVDDPAALDRDTVKDHLDDLWTTVAETDPIRAVIDAMHEKDLRFVVIVDEAGRAAGVTGQKGVMEYVADHFPQHVMVQRVGVKPSTDEREGA